jgi:hypothetical protein
MANENITLKESIEKAANDSTTENNSNGNDNTRKEENEKKDNKSDKPSEEKSNSVEESENESNTNEEDHEQNEEVETGVALLRALRDPKQSKVVVQDLAIRLGLIGNSGEKVSSSDAKDIKAVLKEVLADDYPDLREKLEIVLGKVQEDQDNKIKALESKVSESERIRNEREFMGVYDKFIKDNKVDDGIAAKMIREMQLIPPGPKITLPQYLNKIHSLVAQGANDAKSKVDRASKINSNLKDSTVKNLSSDVSDSRIEKGSHRPSIKEAIAMALDEQRK